MSSLYNRATPSQARILRAVEGAVKNASDAHPELKISPHHRRSIAKRAAGTLTAQWPDVLAASRGSSESGNRSKYQRSRAASYCLKATGREGSDVRRAFPLRRLIAEIARPLRAMKLAGEVERAAAYVDVLRMIDRLRRALPVQPDSEPADAALQVISVETRDDPK